MAEDRFTIRRTKYGRWLAAAAVAGAVSCSSRNNKGIENETVVATDQSASAAREHSSVQQTHDTDTAYTLTPIGPHESITLTATRESPIPEERYAAARACAKVGYEGHEGGGNAVLRRCLSEKTRQLCVGNNGVSGDCLAFVGACPNLESVEARYLLLTSGSLAALLNHPRIVRLDITAEANDLSRLGPLPKPNALRSLELDLEFDWRRPPPNGSLVNRRPAGNFAWLKQCAQLREVTLSMPSDTAFLEAVGQHLQGVERLNLSTCDTVYLQSLAAWPRLRHLCLDRVTLNDAALDQLAAACPELTTLEIDDCTDSGEAITPRGIKSLQQMSNLRRLRVGFCNLTRKHMAEIAKLKSLEALSFEDDKVSDAAIAPLAKLPKLRQISLERTKASNTAFADLRGDWNANRPYRGTIEIID